MPGSNEIAISASESGFGGLKTRVRRIEDGCGLIRGQKRNDEAVEECRYEPIQRFATEAYVYGLICNF